MTKRDTYLRVLAAQDACTWDEQPGLREALRMLEDAQFKLTGLAEELHADLQREDE